MTAQKLTWSQKLIAGAGLTLLTTLTGTIIVGVFNSWQSAQCKRDFIELKTEQKEDRNTLYHFVNRVEKKIAIDSTLLWYKEHEPK